MNVSIYQRIAHLLPSKLVYYCYIRVMANATTMDEGKTLTPDEVTFSKACELWERRYGKIY